MTQIKINRVYEKSEAEDGYRVLVDRLWPRGMKKEYLKYDEDGQVQVAQTRLMGIE